jgi:localization factor PodJL
MIGVAVDLDQPVSEAELEQARRHQAMAAMSGELGNAAGRPAETGSIPKSMVPSEAETEGVAPQAPEQPQANVDPSAAVTRSASPEMPSAMIGPLSLRLAAANGDSSAQFEVGARYAEGKGVPQNFKEAAKWYQRSADQGFAQAQYRLATLYERGLGLKPDRAQAAVFYERAAAQGNIKAMHNLAVLSANQTDRAPDYAAAAHWFSEAAKRGLPDSQFNLAILYENGLGVDRDLKQAFLWVSLAARAGDADATRRRDILRGKLTAQEIADAQILVSNWRMIPSERAINDALVAGDLWKKGQKSGISG